MSDNEFIEQSSKLLESICKIMLPADKFPYHTSEVSFTRSEFWGGYHREYSSCFRLDKTNEFVRFIATQPEEVIDQLEDFLKNKSSTHIEKRVLEQSIYNHEHQLTLKKKRLKEIEDV